MFPSFSKKKVLSWNILTVKGRDNCSAIFLVSAKIDPNLKLDCVSLGKSKNILDKIDLNSTIELFGPLLQYDVLDSCSPESLPSPK